MSVMQRASAPELGKDTVRRSIGYYIILHLKAGLSVPKLQTTPELSVHMAWKNCGESEFKVS